MYSRRKPFGVVPPQRPEPYCRTLPLIPVIPSLRFKTNRTDRGCGGTGGGGGGRRPKDVRELGTLVLLKGVVSGSRGVWSVRWEDGRTEWVRRYLRRFSAGEGRYRASVGTTYVTVDVK